jgi:hypothetical protein
MRKYEEIKKALREKVEAALPLSREQADTLSKLDEDERDDYLLDLLLGETDADETKDWEAILIAEKALRIFPEDITAKLNASEGLTRKQRKGIEKELGFKFRKAFDSGDQEKVKQLSALVCNVALGDNNIPELWHLPITMKILRRGSGLEDNEAKN